MHALGSWCERYRSGTGARQSDLSSLWIKTRSALRLYFARSAPRSLHAPLRSHAQVGTYCFLKTNVTAPVYQEILEHFMLPSTDQLVKDADFIFQQDLAPAHTAKSTKSWLSP